MRHESVPSGFAPTSGLPGPSLVVGTALVASGDQVRVAGVARALAERGVITTVAFGSHQVLDCLDHQRADLLVIDASVTGGHPERFLGAVRTRSDAALLTIGPWGLAPHVLADAGVHAMVGAAATPTAVAAQGLALLGLRPHPDLGVLRVWGPLELDLARRGVRWDGRPVAVSPLEFRILNVLVLARGAVVTKRDLYRLVWGTAMMDDGERVVAHVKRLRDKLETEPGQPRFLLTVRGEGYRLADV